jgi:hypothetical protein
MSVLETKIARIRKAAIGLQVEVFAIKDDPGAEDLFAKWRRDTGVRFVTNESLTTPSEWKIHGPTCSSLSFHDKRKLTSNPKICARRTFDLKEWATKFGVELTRCKRC